MTTPTPPPPAQMKHCPEPAQPSPSVLLAPHLSGAAALLTCVTSVSDPPGQSLSLQTLSCCCLSVSGVPRSPAAVSEGGLGDCPRRLCGCCCCMRVARPTPADLRVVVCAPVGSRAHCLVGFAQERWARQPVGSLGMPRPQQQPPGQTALAEWRRPSRLPYGKLCPTACG